MKKGNKIIYRVLLAFTTLSVILTNCPVSSYAEGFTHKHTEACYREVAKVCNNHELSFGKETRYRDCPKCHENKECFYGTYTDICKSNLIPSAYMGGYIECKTCGTTIESNTPSGPRSHSYTSKELVCEIKEGSEIATVSAYGGDGGWTNKSVTVGCNVDVKHASFSLAGSPYSFNGGAFCGQSSYEVTENGNYSFTVKSSTGETASASVTVNNIDKDAPSVSLSKSTDAWTESGLTITAVASDQTSGLADKAYSFGGGYSSNASMHVNANGTYTVTVIDKAGNTASASITISNVGKDPKVIEEEKKKEEEKKRKEEEERRKREEEERKRKEEEERKKKEEDKKKTEEGDGNKKKGKEESPKEEIVKDDVSSNEVEENSDAIVENEGETINVYEEDESEDDSEDEEVTAVIPINQNPKDPPTPGGNDSFLSKTGGIMGTINYFLMGAILISFAFFVFSSLNIIYTDSEGIIKPIALAKVRKDKKKLFVNIPASSLEKDKKYKLFLSPWSRLTKKDRKLVIDVDGTGGVCIGTDEKSFVYNG